MKSKLLSIFTLLLLLISCGDGYNTPTDLGGTKGDCVADFTYETSHPFYVTFKNTSKGATQFKWDFGDGKTSREESPVHKYDSKGVYKVTLEATKGSATNRYDCTDVYTKTITIKEPTTCYVTGVEFSAIPKNNEYYSVRFTDDYFLFETCYWYTDWCLLSSANLPYKYIFNKRYKLDLDVNTYIMRLYQNSKKSGNGTQIYKWKFDTSDVKAKYSEVRTGTSENAKVSVFLEWDD